MPIQFRCPVCRKKLSISRRKAGTLVACPACAAEVRVPEQYGSTEPQDSAEKTPLPYRTDSARGGSVGGTEGGGTNGGGGADAMLHVIEGEDDEGGFQLSRRAVEDDGLDMTPMVDVVFLLLIFFMITASFSLQKSMETEAPEEDNEGFAQMPRIEDLADESVIVEIDDNDAIFVDDEPVGGLGELQDVLSRKMSVEQKREMIIEPHYQAKHGTVVAVTDAGIEVGMQRIRRVSRSEP